MTVVGRLTSIGTFFAYDYDETVVTKFRIGSDGTAYSNEFDENTSSTLSGSKMMSATSAGDLIVLDSINEIDPFDDLPTSGLQLHLDPALSKTETFPVGQQTYTTAQTTTFVVPAGVTSISAVCIGGGGAGGGGDGGRTETNSGGGGGGLSYGTIAVTPGESLSIVVGSGGNSSAGGNGGSGGDTTISRGGTILLSGGGGTGGFNRNNGNGTGGSSTGTARTGGGTGGNGGTGSNNSGGTGGGGAGGYSGNGGAGGTYNTAGAVGAGGGAGGGGGFSGTTSNTAGGGGGTGILGSGANGTAGTTNGGGGGGGSSGTNGSGNTSGLGGNYGGGGGGASDNNRAGGNGASGAIRIIWGTGRSYPSTSVADAATVNYALTLNDLSGNSRNATVSNGGSYVSTYGGSVLLDGTNDYGFVSAYKGITGTGARTAIIFFRSNLENNFDRIFSWGSVTAAGNKWSLEPDSTTFKLALATSNGSYAVGGSTTPNIMDRQWHMIAASVGASQTVNDIKLYVDGDLLTDVTRALGATAINTASSADVSFGASLADVAPEYLNGYTSKVLIYNRQLDDIELKIIHRTILNRF